jgi:leader peptidase (prepilin peptidase) / N-methyltransferase
MGHLSFFDLLQALLILALLYLAYFDLRTFRLPNIVTLPLILLGLIFNGLSVTSFASFEDSALGAILGYISLWFLNLLYCTLKKQDGIGMGDAKLLAALGAWLGWLALPEILFMASLAGLIGGFIWLAWNKQNYRATFPFCPFLAFAGIIEILWPQILQTFLLNILA